MKLFVMTAVLALGVAPAMAQSGGSGGSGESGGAGAYGGSGKGEQGKARVANQGAVDQADQVSGRIAAVNPTDREVAIDAGSATTQVRLASDAKITVDGKTATLQDLRPGANVRASLDRSGDMPVVKKLDVTTSKK